MGSTGRALSFGSSDSHAQSSLQPSADVATAPGGATSRSTGEQMFLTHLTLIDGITTTVARRGRLSDDEREDFTAVVHFQMIKDDYGILRRFGGRSTLGTFLTVVIQRLLVDFRNARWGRWRPSAASRQRGGSAIHLERLTMRDGLTFDEACAVISAGQDLTAERRSLEQLHARFRSRTRTAAISNADLAELPITGAGADAELHRAEAAADVAVAMKQLSAAVACIPAQDRQILKMRYAESLPFSVIARQLNLDQKALYRRIEKLKDSLRARLESRGVQGDAVLSAIREGWC